MKPNKTTPASSFASKELTSATLCLSWFSIAVTKYHNQIQLTKALNWVTSFRGSEARRQNKSVAAGTAESSYL